MKAQNLQISYNVSTYQGGNNITCHGSSDGWINIFVNSGNPPYFFTWNNGTYNQNINNVTAGSYTVIVTDGSGVTGSQTVILLEPNPLQIHLFPHEYDGGYNISENGGQDGLIETEISGGTSDYTYLWSNNATESRISSVPAGVYSIAVTDMNGCTASASATLIEPTALHVVSITSPLHNGFNVSCNEGQNGAINLSVTGGYPGANGYTYHWNFGGSDQNPGQLHAGHYSIIITDAIGAQIGAQIDLTEPPIFKISSITPVVYPNGYNLSCHSCANGSLTVNTTGGVLPLTYQWETGQSTKTISNLAPNTYSVIATDDNGCSSSASRQIIAPDKEDWSMTGNGNTDSVTQFIGTTDNKPLILKTNNLERIHITKDGKINLNGKVNISELTLSTPLNTDTLKVNRIMAAEGDSIINFGISSLHFNQNSNNLYCTPACFQLSNQQLCIMRGLGIGNFSFGKMDNSIAIGNRTFANALGAIVLGSGPSGSFFYNTLPNSLSIGFNSTTSTVLVTPATTSTTSGNVAIGGWQNPSEKLEVQNGNVLVTGTNNFTTLNDEAILKIGNTNNYIKSVNGKGVRIGTTSNPDIINISSNRGVVGINIDPETALPGNFTTPYKLLVGGSIGANEMWVSLGSPWPDYVFDKNYKLKSLNDLRNYFEKHSHLPDMPSAKEVNKNGKINIGEIQTGTVKNMEEIYLQLFIMQDKIDKLEMRNAALEEIILKNK